ncbi:MAG TPA: choice-of-anchor D domain-containing protein, partial [Edaphobacter sp.]
PIIEYCGFLVTFAPQSIGVRNAFLLLTDNAPDSPQLIPLTGVGIAQPATVAVSPTVLNFYEPGEIKTVTLSNSRTTPISISGIQINSSNWTEFDNCGSQLDAQSTCMIAITAGQSYGQFSGTLTVLDGDASGQPVVQLGSDIRKLSGPAIDLGMALLGITTAEKPLTGGIYDHTAGGSDFYAYSGTISGGSNPNDFFLNPSSCQASTTAGGTAATCQISVGGKPSVAGHLSAYLSTNAGETYLVKQTGLQSNPAFVLSPPALNFGALPMGTSTGLPFTVDTINGNSVTVSVASITQGSGNAGDFSLDYINCPNSLLGTPLAPCPALMHFTPKAMGPRSAIVTFKDLSGYMQYMLVAGQGLESVPIFSPSALNFGNITPGTTSAPQTVTVTLSGGHPATAQILEPNSPYQLSQNTTCAQGANPCQFQVVFSPTTAGTPTGTLQVTDTVTGFSATAKLSGTAGAADISVSPSPLTFAPRTVGVTSLPQNIVVTNSGYLPLTIRWVQIVSTPSIGDYSETNNCGTLNQGQSCIIAVVFTPLATGERDVVILVGSNAISGPTINIPVTGTGN